MPLNDVMNEFRSKLKLIRDISIKPEIKAKKIKKALRKYCSEEKLESEEVLMLVDNTLLRSAKQGMIITSEMLYSFSEISGKFSIRLNDINSVSPQVRKVLGNAQLGIVINDKFFISLPGMTENSNFIRDYIEWEGVFFRQELTSAIVYFSIFLHKILGCKLILEKEPDPGKPPWYNN